MLFPTIDFAIFFAVVFLGNWLLSPSPRRWKPFILTASYVFYAWWDWRFVLLLAVSTLISAVGGLAVAQGRTRRARRGALVMSVVGHLALLGWFKYYGFLSVTFDNALHSLGLHATPLPPLSVTLPVGISFFTFMGLSYVIDIYRRDLEPAPFLDVAVYVAFFPHLIAGPIVRGRDLLPQIARSRLRDPRKVEFPEAAYLIMGGLFKKVVISSYVSSAIVGPVFNNPTVHTAPEILLAVYGYAVQIYCDFSGYTDIAIGVALLLGFRFPQNFDRPYAARSLQDFWRRWHMTLSSWLRDYLYIPLGGNRGPRRQVARNIMITMLLGGLWHGAAWTFVAWGGIHGVGQVAGHLHRERRVAQGRAPEPTGRAALLLGRLCTFHVVCLGWLFFRADTFGTAFTLLRRLFTTWGEAAPLFRLPVVATIVGSIALQYLPKGLAEAVQVRFAAMHAGAKAAFLGCGLLLITTLGPPGVAPFIYYKF
ncbi:MAG TPA: MBOAT family protein [Acidimicrobiales bacterium]|nr:MBOAT family protein [Acidimicrobiales bacterium]